MEAIPPDQDAHKTSPPRLSWDGATSFIGPFYVMPSIRPSSVLSCRWLCADVPEAGRLFVPTRGVPDFLRFAAAMILTFAPQALLRQPAFGRNLVNQ